MIEPEKLIRKGKVAVLISPGFGAGWSTWVTDPLDTFLLFDRRVVEAREKNATAEEVEKLVRELTGERSFYTGGWHDVEIQWVDPGTVFYVNEYEGHESLRYSGDGSKGWQKA